MHYRRLASLALGAWLAGSVMALWFSSENVATIDQRLRAPSKDLAAYLARVELSDADVIVRHHASEVNRSLFATWERVEIVLGLALLAGLFFGPDSKRFTIVLCLMMLACVIFLHWFLTPEMAKVGQVVDFVAPDHASVARDRLRSLNTGYQVIGMVKLGLGLVIAWALVTRRRRRVSEAS